jgi:hypothetical protein
MRGTANQRACWADTNCNERVMQPACPCPRSGGVGEIPSGAAPSWLTRGRIRDASGRSARAGSTGRTRRWCACSLAAWLLQPRRRIRHCTGRHVKCIIRRPQTRHAPHCGRRTAVSALPDDVIARGNPRRLAALAVQAQRAGQLRSSIEPKESGRTCTAQVLSNASGAATAALVQW